MRQVCVGDLNILKQMGGRLAGFFNALLQVSALMEEVCYNCFEARLDLDPELGRMRAEFLKVRQWESRHLMEIYKQGRSG